MEPKMVALNKSSIRVLVGTGVVLAFGLVANRYSEYIPSTPNVAEQTAEFKLDAQMAIKGQLRDPDSAEFSDFQLGEWNGQKAVCGSVNAKNGHGGYSGFHSFVYTSSFGVVFDSGVCGSR
jgi:hypothetical protein